jgi:RNA polymerase sigma factor (sigma-70 family)
MPEYAISAAGTERDTVESDINGGELMTCAVEEGTLLDHWAALVRVTQGLVDSREDAEDCASAALVQLLEQTADEIANTEAFLVTVAKRRAADRARAQARSRRRDVRLAGMQPLNAADLAEDIAARAEARWVDAVAREHLSPKAYRLVRLLADGHDVREAARIMGMTERAAESLLLRARRTVRRAWAKTLGVVGACVAALRQHADAAAPVATLAASVLLVTTGGPAAGTAPAPVHIAASSSGGASPVAVARVASRPKPPARPAAGYVHRPARVPVALVHRPSTPAPAVHMPMGGSVWVTHENRPGGDGSPGDTVLRCLSDFRVTPEHVGC